MVTWEEWVRVRVGETRYTDDFRIEWALKGGHVSIATWMHSLGYRVSHFDASRALREGNMAAFYWLFKEYPPAAPLQLDHTILDFSTVRYLIEACNARPPLPWQLRKMFKQKKLPAAADVLAYYYSVCPDLIPDRILHKALSGGKWALVDFIIGPEVPPKHRLDLDTGEVIPLCF
jgi:hypothetical protein